MLKKIFFPIFLLTGYALQAAPIDGFQDSQGHFQNSSKTTSLVLAEKNEKPSTVSDILQGKTENNDTEYRLRRVEEQVSELKNSDKWLERGKWATVGAAGGAVTFALWIMLMSAISNSK